MTQRDPETPDVGSPVDRGVRPEPDSSRGGTCKGYAVEARVEGPPRQIAGQMFDGQWRRVQFVEAPPGFGVPAQGLYSDILGPHGLMTHEGAQAMRWWFVTCDRPLPFVHTRLMEYEVRYSTSATKTKPISEVSDACRGV